MLSALESSAPPLTSGVHTPWATHLTRLISPPLLVVRPREPWPHQRLMRRTLAQPSTQLHVVTARQMVAVLSFSSHAPKQKHKALSFLPEPHTPQPLGLLLQPEPSDAVSSIMSPLPNQCHLWTTWHHCVTHRHPAAGIRPEGGQGSQACSVHPACGRVTQGES